MDNTTNKNHWETVYETKSPEQVSWTQEVPQTSLDLISSFGLGKNASIIDIGGGDSRLVDCLLEQGYEDITVLDISEKALERAKRRLGKQAEKVKWLVSDVTAFKPHQTYDIWHDRAAFHFLTTPTQLSAYLDVAQQAASGFLAVGTFSTNGPTKCSGLEIRQYNEQTLALQFEPYFDKLSCRMEDHITPFNTVQNFIFCSFKRKE
ncbi:class I SAM-dependent methyltransferase [Pedobacter sp. KR3-3]|uniref:Class I SAM-dependent methyltransferase n=1 Tax=Pedobacter albus TaxID=3113905 RepID=A0ABU7I276_9SPHI|nr:class I SAM-dependent methyltransferase [Pedobacter sp. KR3-3]MEE1943504.1 class I SAM-dependent methyltransferase [Pedobacter sp. KR3-3]